MSGVVGIDLGTRKIAVSSYTGEENLEYCLAFTASEKWSRPTQLRFLADTLFDLLDSTQPDHVFMESVIVGNNRKYSIGLAEVAGALMSNTPDPLPETHRIDNKTWKKQLIGNGNATKQDIALWLKTEYPRYSLQCAGDQDRVDATCIALQGSRIAGWASNPTL